jgi:aspartate racemase
MHKVADAVAAAVRVPLLHIADATGAAIERSVSKRPLLLATRYTMEQPFWRDRVRERFGLSVEIPDDAGRTTMHDIIFDELVHGRVLDASKARVLDVIARARAHGADGVIFGCTEIGMLLSQADMPEPVFDTAILHAKAAVDFALG